MNRFLGLCIGFFSIGAVSQHLESPLVQYNLKGKVSKVEFSAEKNLSVANEQWFDKIAVLKNRLEAEPVEFDASDSFTQTVEFDQNGFVIKKYYKAKGIVQNGMVTFAYSPIQPEIMKIATAANIDYPGFDPRLVRQGFIERFKSDSDNSQTESRFVYRVDGDRITSETHYYIFKDGEEEADEFKMDSLVYKANYFYNPQRQLAKKEIVVGQELLQEYVTFIENGTACEPNEHLTLNYSYSDGRLTKVTALKNGDFDCSQTYFWTDGKISAIELISAYPPFEGASHKIIRRYDDNGNVTRIDHYDWNFGRTISFSEYYQYEFDSTGNWTVCRAYIFEPKPENLAATLKRTISYF